jgi:hypothetical protein
MTTPGTQQQDPNSFLMGSGAKSATFTHPGQEIGGRIISEPELRQQTEYVKGGGAGKPLFWDNGDPRMQLVVKVQTNLRDDSEDDGVRAFYVKGGFKRDTTQKAVADAVRAAGAKGLQVGGELYITFVSQDGPSQDDAKNYRARYVPAVAGADFLGTQQPTPAAASPAAPAASAPAAPATSNQLVTVVVNGQEQQVTPEVAALLGQVQPGAASA